MAMDRQDGEDLLEDESPLLTSIAIQIEGGLLIVAMRRLPEYVALDRSLRVDPTCGDIYTDELASRMLMNMSISSCVASNSLLHSRLDVLNTTH